jgi:hypothetical protein
MPRILSLKMEAVHSSETLVDTFNGVVTQKITIVFFAAGEECGHITYLETYPTAVLIV